MSGVSDSTQTTGPLPGVPAGTWQIDPAHSVVGFAVRHLMSRVRGTFPEFTGAITIAEDPLQSAVQVEIAVASVSTGQGMRDDHLRSQDFFGIDDHPTMTFTSTGLRAAEGSWVLDGRLTIRDTTRPVQLDVEFLGFDPTGAQGEPRVGFAGRTSIKRSDFGITFGLVDDAKIVIGDEIDIQLEVEATLG